MSQASKNPALVIPLRQPPLNGTKPTCADCGRNKGCFGRHLPSEDLKLLKDIEVSQRLHHRGDHVFHSGSEFEALYVVKSGNVKTTMISEDGEEQIIAFYGTGDIIGLDAIANNQHACNAIALDTCSLCVIQLGQALHSASNSQAFCMAIMKLMSENLLRDERMLLSLGKKDAQQRMAGFLLEQSRNQQRRGFSANTFNLAMSRSDIGNHLNLAVETVSRLLTRFKNRGLIKVNRNEIEINDHAKLSAISGESNLSPGLRTALVH